MYLKSKSFFLAVLLGMLLSVGCMRKDGENKVDKNVIKDYVRNPLDKAEGAKSKVEDKQDQLRRQADLLER